MTDRRQLIGAALFLALIALLAVVQGCGNSVRLVAAQVIGRG